MQLEHWPLPPEFTIISQKFGEHPEWYAPHGLAGHEGWDFPCPVDTPTFATHDGWIDPSWRGEYGNSVRVRGEGFFTFHAHLVRTIGTYGQRVRAGQIVGRTGDTGLNDDGTPSCTGFHLHWGIQVDAVANVAYKNWLDPEPFLQRRRAMKTGWHVGNESAITALDWRIMKILVPGCIVWMPGQQITRGDIQRVLALNSSCDFHMRPYVPPSVAANDAEIAGYFDRCKHDMDDWTNIIPAGQKHIQIFNEQNMPPTATMPQGEGFGSTRDDMIRFNDWFCEGYHILKAHDPSWKIGYTPLTPGNRDEYHLGDLEEVDYYMHGPEVANPNPTPSQLLAAIQSCLNREALELADEFLDHIYLHEYPADAPYGGLRFAEKAKFFPKPMDIWITECGYPSKMSFDGMPSAGDKIVKWLRLLQGYSVVKGVCFWILGEHWDGIWYDGDQPRGEVYQIAEYLVDIQPEPELESEPEPEPPLGNLLTGVEIGWCKQTRDQFPMSIKDACQRDEGREGWVFVNETHAFVGFLIYVLWHPRSDEWLAVKRESQTWQVLDEQTL